MKITIAKKLGLGFGICIGFLILLAGITIYEIRILQGMQDDGAKRAIEAMQAGNSGRLGERLYTIIADAIINRNIEASQKNWKIGKQIAETELETLEKSVDTEQEKKWIASTRKAYTELIDHVDKDLFPLLKNTNGITPEILALDEEIDKHVKAMAAPLDLLRESLKKEMVKADEDFDSNANLIFFLCIGFSLSGIIISLVFAYRITTGITQPVSALTAASDEIAKGRFPDRDLAITSRDEIGLLAAAFDRIVRALKNKAEELAHIADGDLTITVRHESDGDQFAAAFERMIRSLNDAFRQVSAAVDQVSAGAGQVSAASQSLSQGASEQASSLEEITSSIIEINSQSKQNADNAIQVTSMAKSALDGAEAGNSQMKELVLAMTDINKSAGGIKKIAKSIDDIAFQINLLALNANVEAARAGKYGKGFAVVADEVRNLAARSGISVKEATTLVDEAIHNIDNGNRLAEVTAKKIGEIVAIASKVAGIAEEVTIASKEQSLGLDQISVGLNQIDQVTQANTSNAEESASASEELASQAQQLKAMIGRFKLGDGTLNKDDTTDAATIQKLVELELSRM